MGLQSKGDKESSLQNTSKLSDDNGPQDINQSYCSDEYDSEMASDESSAQSSSNNEESYETSSEEDENVIGADLEESIWYDEASGDEEEDYSEEEETNDAISEEGSVESSFEEELTQESNCSEDETQDETQSESEEEDNSEASEYDMTDIDDVLDDEGTENDEPLQDSPKVSKSEDEDDHFFDDLDIKRAASNEMLFDVDSIWNSASVSAAQKSETPNVKSVVPSIAPRKDDPISDNFDALNNQNNEKSLTEKSFGTSIPKQVHRKEKRRSDLHVKAFVSPSPITTQRTNKVSTPISNSPLQESAKVLSSTPSQQVDGPEVLDCTPVPYCDDDDSPKRRALSRTMSGCGQVFSNGLHRLVNQSQNLPNDFLAKDKSPLSRDRKPLIRGSFMKKKSTSTLQKYQRKSTDKRTPPPQLQEKTKPKHVRSALDVLNSSTVETPSSRSIKRLQSDASDTSRLTSDSFSSPRRTNYVFASPLRCRSPQPLVCNTPTRNFTTRELVQMSKGMSPLARNPLGSSSSDTDVSSTTDSVPTTTTTLPPVTAAEAERRASLASEKREAKRQRKRARIIEELLATEGTYQRHLELGVQLFEDPLRRSKIIPETVTVTIFSNLRQIISVNRELVEHLEGLSIGRAFLKLGPFLKLYSTYAKNHERALAVLMEWDQKSPEFSAFRRQQEDLPEMNGLKLNSLLITPVQRIPRYKLLLEELLANTLPDHKDYDAIKEAVRQVAAVANHINDHIKQQDNFMKMLAIQKSLTGQSKPKLLIPGRMFIKEGTLKKVSKSGGRSYERRFFLFSDILMYAKPKLLESGTSHSYICCCILPLQHCQVSRVFGHSQGQGALFTVRCKEETLLLFSDSQTVNSWITVLEAGIREFNDSRQTLRKVSSAKQPLRKAAIAKLLKHEKDSDPLTAALRRTPDKASPRSLKRALQEMTNTSTGGTPSPRRTTPQGRARTPSEASLVPEKATLMDSLGCLSPCGFSRRWRASSRPYVKRTESAASEAELRTSVGEEGETEEGRTPLRGQENLGYCNTPAPSRHLDQSQYSNTPSFLSQSQRDTPTSINQSQRDTPSSVNQSHRDVSGVYSDVWRLPDESCLSTPSGSPLVHPVTTTTNLATIAETSPGMMYGNIQRHRDNTNQARRHDRPISLEEGSKVVQRNRPMSLEEGSSSLLATPGGVESRTLPYFSLSETPGRPASANQRKRKDRPISVSSENGSVNGSDRDSPAANRSAQRLRTAVRAASTLSKAYMNSPAVNYGAACNLQ